MEHVTDDLWIAACAHWLQVQWRTVAPEDLHQVAEQLAHEPELRAMPPVDAVAHWLEPMRRTGSIRP